MKKALFLSIALMLFFVNSIFAQSAPGDKVIGVWLTAEKDGKIEIYKAGSKYNGKIVWGKDLYEANGKTLTKDAKNPDANYKNRPLLNADILTGFVYLNNEWTEGKIYDPKSGKTYSATMKLKGNTLALRGYIGVSMFGRTTSWERVK
ncbi:MAG: DUF2147 domain-containing protein [Janthinobacterium lividum]